MSTTGTEKPVPASAGKVTTFQSIEQKQRVGDNGTEGGEETPEAKLARETAEAEKYKGLTEEQITAKKKEETEAAEAEAEKYKGLTPEQVTAKKAEEATAAAEAAKTKLPELTNDQLKALLKGKGIEFEGDIDALKNKLNPAAEPTEEEKKTAATAKELEAQKLFLSLDKENTIEKFAALKAVAAMDEKELSDKSLKNELKAAGFDDDEIKEIIAQRYFQIDLATLEPDTEESDADFAKRKAKLEKQVKYGATKLENRGKTAKSQAATTLDNLYKAIEQSALQKQEAEKEEKLLSSTIDEIFQKTPKKQTIDLGKDSEEAIIPPIEYDVADSDLAEVKELLKDTAKRNKFLYNEAGDLNVQNIANVLIENAIMKSQRKVVYLESGSRQAEIFYNKFPHRSAQSLGLGANTGANNNVQKNQPVTKGKPQRV